MPKHILEPQRLAKLANHGFRQMTRFRKARLQMLQQYTTRFYRRDDTLDDDRAFPLNMMYHATTTLVPNLAYSDPKARISSRWLPYREYADIAELALNHLIEEVGVRGTLRRVITDAIFLAGFTKCGLAVSGRTLDLDGYQADVGQPYFDRVDPDDMILDPVARQWEEQRFIGNRYRADVDTLRQAGTVPDDAIDRMTSRYSDQQRGAEAAMLSRDDVYDADQIVPSVELVDLWVPQDNVMVTMPGAPGGEVSPEIIAMNEWNGPEQGPYDMLGFAWVPDNILPVPPGMVWYDLAVMANRVARKAANQAERQKSVLAYESSAWRDAQEIADADDGQSVRVDDIEAIKEVSFGGVQEDAYQYIEWAKAQFAEMAMNIDLLSGAGSDEATATQAEMVQANTSVRLSDLQSIVYNFTAEQMKRLFFYLHTDPLIELPLVKRTQGQDMQVVYTPEMREGDWIDYNIKVKPYSMARQDPNMKVRRLLEFVGNGIPALAQAFQLLGPAFNIENALSVLGQEMGVEELDELINSPALHMQLQRMMEMLEQGVPLDPKVIQTIMQARQPGLPASGVGPAGPAPQAGGGRPQQPNPRGNIPGGVTPGTERNQRRQETAGEIQGAYR